MYTQADGLVCESSSQAMTEEESRDNQQSEQHDSNEQSGHVSEYTKISRGCVLKKMSYKESGSWGRKDTVNATVQTHNSMYNKRSIKTTAQRAKFLQKIPKARRNNKPMVYRDMTAICRTSRGA